MDKLCLIPLLVLCLAGCQSDTPPEHPAPEVESTQISLWNQEIELFIEHPPFVVGVPTRFVTHVTHLDQWLPRTSGEIHLILTTTGQPAIEIHDPAPVRNGIYIPTLTFPSAGLWDIEVRVPLETGINSQTISAVTVYATEAESLNQPAAEEGNSISFLKEQQWQMPFASEPVGTVSFRESIRSNGMITSRAAGEVKVLAPVSGRLLASGADYPHIGALVSKGQKLVSLVPRLSQADDLASLTLAMQKAELDYDFAQIEFKRIKGLFEMEAVPENRLNLAELNLNTATAERVMAKGRLQQYSAAQKDTDQQGQARIDLYAPLSGTIIETSVVPGAQVAEGDPLFHVVDLTRVWLNIQIPEGDIGKVTGAQSAWFTVNGLDQVFRVDPNDGGRFVALGGSIDLQRRTVPLIFELPNPEGHLRIGMFAQVSVLTGEPVSGASIPTSALIEEGGSAIAYVQVSGEAFERRVITLGIQDGNLVQVLSGIQPGERVVTKGAYQIRLAAASTTLPAHGHEH